MFSAAAADLFVPLCPVCYLAPDTIVPAASSVATILGIALIFFECIASAMRSVYWRLRSGWASRMGQRPDLQRHEAIGGRLPARSTFRMNATGE